MHIEGRASPHPTSICCRTYSFIPTSFESLTRVESRLCISIQENTTMQWSYAVFMIALAYVLRRAVFDTSGDCRCGPDDPCWPSPEQWGELNMTIGGHLHALRPAGHSCVGSDASSEACGKIQANFHNTTWRVLNPGRQKFITVIIKLTGSSNGPGGRLGAFEVKAAQLSSAT